MQAPESLRYPQGHGTNLPTVSHGEEDFQAPYPPAPFPSRSATPSAPLQQLHAPLSKDEFFDLIERKMLERFLALGGTAGVAQALATDLSQGIDPTSAAHRQEEYGRNVLPPAEQVTFWGLVFEALKDRMMQLLIVAAIVSIIFGMTLKNPHTNKVDRETGWIEGTAILISVALVVLVSSVNDYQKSKKFKALSDLSSKKEVTVIRGGQRLLLDVDDLVVGDLLVVESGQTLAADGLFVHGQDLKCDESSATGESDLQKKDAQKDPFLISGTSVTDGDGTAIVIGVGESSFAGQLTMKTRGPPSSTPLQVKLSNLADMIGKLGLLGGIVTFLVLSIKEIVQIAKKDHRFTIVAFLNYLLVSVALVVVAIPEGLPLAVTIALAYSMKSMLADQCLVRVLASCETMGGTSAVCSDKTGTLTTNQMTVVQGWIAGEDFLIDGYGCTSTSNASLTPVGSTDGISLRSKPETIDCLCESLALNSSPQTTEKLVDGRTVWTGNPTEQGLLGFVKRARRDYQVMRSAISAEKRRAYPFSSQKKRMTTIIQMPGGRQRVHVKGASELVLADCTWAMGTDGQATQLNADTRKALLDTISLMASQGNRTIGIAYSDVSGVGFPEEETVPSSLTLVAILGIQDPIRTEVPHAVQQCSRAGIVVRMVTGDNMQTAVAIARKCGILPAESKAGEEEYIAMEGQEFRQLCRTDPERVVNLLPRLRVLARSTPTDKHVLVACLMDEGEIVAVTGDGTNDAPALKLADVGFAMQAGTDIAKGAADMILQDNNFATVVRATLWGRTVNDNIRKFLQFQLTVNVAGVLLTLLGSATSENNEEPLRPVQLLWLNLIMDTLAALALATERPSESCLLRDPAFRSAPLISRRMGVFIVGHAVYQVLITMLLLHRGHRWFRLPACTKEDTDEGAHMDGRYCKDSREHTTLVFNTFIWMQLFNQFNARLLYGGVNPFYGLQRSAIMLFLLALEAGLQVLAVQVGGRFMSTAPIGGREWAGCILLGAVELPLGLLLRFIPVREWRPRSSEDNKKAMAEAKRDEIRIAKEAAGMFGQASTSEHLVQRTSEPEGDKRELLLEAGQQKSAREKWVSATATVRTQQRVVRAFEAAGQARYHGRRSDLPSHSYYSSHLGMPLGVHTGEKDCPPGLVGRE